MKSVASHLLSLFLFGGVFITSKHFMNVENDAKAYFIGGLLILLLLVSQSHVKDFQDS